MGRAGVACSVQRWRIFELRRRIPENHGQRAARRARRPARESESTPDVSARLRYHSKDADAEQAARRIQGTSQWSHQRAGSAHAKECVERAAGSSSGQGEEAADIPGGSEGPLAGVIYAGRLRSVGPVPRRSSRAEILLSPARDPLNPKKATRSPDPVFQVCPDLTSNSHLPTVGTKMKPLSRPCI